MKTTYTENPSKTAMGKAARLWCLPETEHCSMQPEIAVAMAKLIDQYREALIWMSGAADFTPYQPWIDIRDNLICDPLEVKP